MLNIATYFAKLKSWQIFLATGAPFIAQQIYVGSVISKWSGPLDIDEFDALFSQGYSLGLAVFFVVLIWLWSISAIANQKVPEEIRPSMKLYSYVVPYTFLYLAFAGFYFPQLMRVDDPAVPIGVIFPLHLVATVGMFYSLIFPAKNLVLAERGKTTPFSGYLWTLILLWLFPLGVWVVQPRLTRLLTESRR